MASGPRSALSLLGIILFACLAGAAAVTGDEKPTAYEMLEKYGFPRGILPEGVTSYVLREDNTFEAHLGGHGDCDFSVEGGYVLNYKRKITGRLDKEAGALKDLRGVSVKILFVWLSINEVVKSSGSLSFFVGPLSASFPLSNFEECPRCRCGFDCVTAAMVADS